MKVNKYRLWANVVGAQWVATVDRKQMSFELQGAVSFSVFQLYLI